MGCKGETGSPGDVAAHRCECEWGDRDPLECQATGRCLSEDEAPDAAKVSVWNAIMAERDRQDAKWGGVPGIDRRDDHTYAAVLGEEFGEVCKAWLERDIAGLREELIQTAAVAIAWIEELDNGGGVARAAA